MNYYKETREWPEDARQSEPIRQIYEEKEIIEGYNYYYILIIITLFIFI